MDRKRNRLKDFNYIGNYAYFLTLLTSGKTQYFVDKILIEKILVILRDTSSEFKFEIFAYCFMPDHLHLLVTGKCNGDLQVSNLINFIKKFKQKSGFYFKKEYNKNLWHKSYYDHVVRKEENLETVALYILNNPVRKGLVGDYRNYEFSGSVET